MTEYLRDNTGRVYDVNDWRRAGGKIDAAPATLTAEDVAIIRSFGGDESAQRAIAAREKALAPPTPPLLTKTIRNGNASHTEDSRMTKEQLEKFGEDMAAQTLTIMKNALVSVKADIERLDRRLENNPILTLAMTQIGELQKENSSLRERVAVAEARTPQPGPPGPPGEAGLGFDDLVCEFDGERTITLKFQRGLQRKEFPLMLPFLKYTGVYQAGKMYERSDVCTWDGSIWISSGSTTDKPGDGSKFWQLAVKKGSPGRDLRDVKDVAATVPVVSVGKPKSDTIFSNAPVVS